MSSEAAFPVELVDENAFGLLVSWFDAEEVEYSQSADKFPPRIAVFRSAIRSFVQEHPLGDGALVLDFGTSAYFEVPESDEAPDMVTWARELRKFLEDGDWRTFGVITYGGRWVPESPEQDHPFVDGTGTRFVVWSPSEPYRKAMYAESQAHDDEETEQPGWGPGLFVDADVLEAQNRRLKNEPTALYVSGACFYRIGR